MSNSNEINPERKLMFEQFEQRLVMTAQAVANVLPEMETESTAIVQQAVSLDDSVTKQASDIAAEYGLDGAGQTVAVIDSGIAWDHYAFGNGYGEGHRVVGGWDFAENDANPYDDGPAGYHGSHVSGIIGSSDAEYSGVSSGVDLVALRVFTDGGEGNLDWVEQALQWVHEHKDDFANPITTVNLSLGTDWNADSMPEWANLEDEFAQLKADGLFISVAAGNSFMSTGQAGLSYPAVSESVIPVASHGDDGSLSDFSQRDSNVLVAPGESIRSTVPDHLFGGTSGNEFLGSTGTSMAAPYVAGASAVLRQANEFMGVTDVNQDMLYQQFRETADQVYDSVTGGYYYNISLDAALASVIQDRHAATGETATNLGSVSGGELIEGTIGKISDVDAFQFTAQHTGQVTLNFEVTDNLVPLIEVDGTNATFNGHEITFNVVAGQRYDFAVATAEGTGHYRVNVESSNTGSNSGGQNNSGNNGGVQAGSGEAINWGGVVSKDFVDQTIQGSQTFELTSLRNGYLTVESSIASNESMSLNIYDSQMNLLKSVSAVDGEMRLDVNATAGEKFIVEAVGNAQSASFRLTNLVSVSSGSLFVHGTNSNDNISVSTDNGFDVNVNGVEYSFAQSAISKITVVGHQSNDSIDLQLGNQNDRVNTRTEGVSAANNQFVFNAFGFSSVSVDGGGGQDQVSMIGSAATDSVVAGMQNGSYTTELSGSNFSSKASGFELVHVVGTQGSNAATINGTQGNDLFVSRGERSWLKQANGTLVMVDGYDSVAFNGGGGNDYANLYDSVGNDQFVLDPNSATLTTDSYQISINDVQRVNAFSTSGSDSVTFNDSAGKDTFDHRNGLSVLNGNGYTSLAKGFANVHVVSQGGNDIAQVFDTAGDDTFYGNQGDTEMHADGLWVSTEGFKHVNLIARNGGHDRAVLTGTDREDVVLADVDSARLTMSNGQSNRVVGMEETQVDMGGGIDLAFITGSEGQERLEAGYSEVELETTLQLLRMTNVEHTHFEGNGGGDQVSFEEFGELDLLESLGDEAVAYLKDHTVHVKEIANIEANTVDDAIASYDLQKVDFDYILSGDWLKK